MESVHPNSLPRMLYADERGRMYDHPYLRMAGFSGDSPQPLHVSDLIPMPPYSKLFFIPDCPPIGLDPETGEHVVFSQHGGRGGKRPVHAVAAFPEPGFVRSHLPATDYSRKTYSLPMWAYTAVGFLDGRYWIAGFRIEYSRRWDPRQYDDQKLLPAIEAYRRRHDDGPLVRHLIRCATDNHCFAAKNLFFERWEAPLPVSRKCNASCLGCLSLQPPDSCQASHQRIGFRPTRDEIVSIAAPHLEEAPEAIASFGQGCEGEPLTEHRLIADSIHEIRRRTGRGTINLNTNGSIPGRVRRVAESGLDSIRISINSALPDVYAAYYRPGGYDLSDVVGSIALCRELGLYTMVNYLVFPGVSDRASEVEALGRLIRQTGLHFLHLKNLNIDPRLYLEKMPPGDSPALGMKRMVDVLRERFPDLKIGYFNQPVH